MVPLRVSSSLLSWLTAEVNADEVETIGMDMLKKIVKTGNSLAVIFSDQESDLYIYQARKQSFRQKRFLFTILLFL